MDRRTLLGGMGGAAALAGLGSAQTQARKTRCYLQHTYYLKNGTQGPRLAEYLSKTWLPAVTKIHSGPVLVLEAQVAAHLPHVCVITGYASAEEMWSVRAKLTADKTLEAATDAWQKAAEAPYEFEASNLLEAAPFSPEIVPLNPPPKTPRTFELRVYHSPTSWQQRGLMERFATDEARILAKCGAQQVFFTSGAIGADTPNVTWMIAFDDMAGRDKFSAAFAVDPEWIKVRAASVAKYGESVTVRKITLYKAAAYSPIL
jgi:hypothetical protein